MIKARCAVAMCVISAFFFAFAAHSFAENIGYIDVTKVFKEYKETIKAEEQLKKEKDEYEKKFKEAQDKLEKADKDKKSQKEIEELRKELEQDLEPKRKSLFDLNEQLTTRLQADILDVVKRVAKKVGIDMVLDKQVLIVGGVDLTEMVINELNKGK